MTSSSQSRKTGVYPMSYPMTLSRYPENPQSFNPTPVRSASGDEFHSPKSQPGAVMSFAIDEPASMGQAPPSPSPPRSVETGAVQAMGGRGKKRQEQNRNAQRLYRQRKAQYVQGLLRHVDEINKRHTSLQSSYKALCHETAGLQGQVEALKEQLEFWSRVEVVLLSTPEGDHPIAGTGGDARVNPDVGGGGEMGFLGESYPLYPDLSYHQIGP
ncbi:hypothetical protein ASPCAL09587 [Aspergillus calidoustus]|uniref:BZIP domain-containing protein n=1 Tax=Aspergillus calidoustus TaxID=454130 RepID=A0A0U5GUR9_ASPCI|nr:hypothetical protein ASPCAL09587 [Aspergillus calidoustus]